MPKSEVFLYPTYTDIRALRLADLVREGGYSPPLCVQGIIDQAETWVHENARRWGEEQGATVVALVDGETKLVVRRVKVKE